MQTGLNYNEIEFVKEFAQSHRDLLYAGDSGLRCHERSFLHDSLARGGPWFRGRRCGEYFSFRPRALILPINVIHP